MLTAKSGRGGAHPSPPREVASEAWRNFATAERRELREARPGAPAVRYCGLAPACPAFAELKKQLMDDSDV
eukprot:1543230-Alexandrium_andersonii.AAC.1